MTTGGAEKSQADKFKALAKELDADEDEGHFNERLKKVVKAPRQGAEGGKPPSDDKGG